MYKIIKRNNVNIVQKRLDIIVFIGIIIFLFLQILFIRIFSILPRWDVGWIYNMAATLNNGEALEIEQIKYLYYYRHNYPLLVVYEQIFNLFGAHMIKMYYVGGISISASIGLLYMIFRRNLSTKGQLIGMVTIFAFLPMSMYSIIPYSDVLALPFCVASIFVVYRNRKINYDFKSVLLFSVFIGIGSIFKILLLIFAIAYAIQGVIQLKTYRKIFIITPFIFTLIFSSVFGAYIDSKNYSYAKYEQSGISPFYYMYLGMNDDSNGRYNEQDYIDSLQWGIRLEDHEKNEVRDYYIDGIVRRLQDMGIFGFFDFMGRKTYETWSDGSLQMIEYLKTEPTHSNIIQTYFVEGFGSIILQIIWQIIYMFLLIGLWIGTRKKDDANMMFYLIFLGFFAYLSLFEAGPRYLLLFVPIMLLINAKNFDEFNV